MYRIRLPNTWYDDNNYLVLLQTQLGIHSQIDHIASQSWPVPAPEQHVAGACVGKRIQALDTITTPHRGAL